METSRNSETMRQKLINTKIAVEFGDGFVDVDLYPIENSNKLVINIHGTYGSKDGGNDKYKNFAGSLQREAVANSLLYQSSRKDNVESLISKGNKDPFEIRRHKFIGKRLIDELNELRTVINHCIDNSQELFGIDGSELNITLNGNSLGGILAFMISEEFPQVQNIVTVGTGISPTIGDGRPILSEWPDAETIKKYIANFKGKALFCYGTQDIVFTEDSFNQLLEAFPGTDNMGYLQLIGVDHSFGKISGKSSQMPYKHIYQAIKELIVEGKIAYGDEEPDHEDVIERVEQALAENLNPIFDDELFPIGNSKLG